MESSVARLKYMNEAYEMIKKDIALTVRATEKAMVDKSNVQKDKLQQVRIIRLHCVPISDTHVLYIIVHTAHVLNMHIYCTL